MQAKSQAKRKNKTHSRLARHEASGVISSWADVSCQQAIRSLGNPTRRGLGGDWFVRSWA